MAGTTKLSVEKALEKLRRKYGATLEEVIAFHQDVSRNLSAVESSGERHAALAKEVAALTAGYEAAAGRSQKRTASPGL